MVIIYPVTIANRLILPVLETLTVDFIIFFSKVSFSSILNYIFVVVRLSFSRNLAINMSQILYYIYLRIN